MKIKPIVLLTFLSHGQNGGPYVSHERIMKSKLNEKYEFIPLFVPRSRVLLTPIGFYKFVKSIKRLRPDIVHIVGLQIEGFMVSIAVKAAGVKNTVLAVHGSSSEAMYTGGAQKKIINILECLTLKNALVCYGVSDYVTNWKIINEHAKHCFGTIYNLPQEEYSKKNNQSFRSEIGASVDDFLIVSTGRITRDKGFDVLLDVIVKKQWRDDIKFIIVGEGNFREQFISTVKNKKLEKSVFVLGYRNDIDRILSESDLFIICTFHETLCNSIIEAGQQSLPVIASNVGGIPEVIISNYNGILVEPGNADNYIMAIEEILKSNKLRESMKIAAKHIINEKFSKELILEKIEKLYEEVLSGNFS